MILFEKTELHLPIFAFMVSIKSEKKLRLIKKNIFLKIYFLNFLFNLWYSILIKENEKIKTIIQ